jgi:quercetin dioxygenase-like cupin family protein
MQMTETGMTIVRVADLVWKDRVNLDNWPSRSGMYYDNPDLGLCIRLVEYPVGAVEPRHVHPGSHAATLLRGRALVEGLTLGPLDVVLGPSNEPHGPLTYPEGVKIFSAFLGSYFHNEVDTPSTETNFRLIQQADIPWEKRSTDRGEVKTLVDRGLGPMLVEVLRFPRHEKIKPTFLAAIVVDGEAEIGGETLGTWDFFHADDKANRGEVYFPHDATLIAITMR